MKASIFAASVSVVTLAGLMFSTQEAQAQVDGRLWGLSQVGADKAWALGYRGLGVIIGVMDESADPLHTEYQDRWLGGMNVDDTPYVLDPNHNHGTHVTGTIAGRRVGVAPGASIYNVNWSLSGVPIDASANGYYWSASRNVRAINNSWGLNRFDAALGKNRSIAVDEVDAQFIQTNLPNLLGAVRALAQQDIVQIFSTSNDRILDYGNGDIRYTLQPGVLAALPTFFPELTSRWIAVTAVGPTGDYGYYAQPCGVAKHWCMAAPGGSGQNRAEDQIFSSLPGDIYGYQNGTSMAAPHVTGAFAIGAEMFPNASGAQITQLLLQTSKDIGAPGVDDNYGWGLLSVANMAAAISPTTASAFANAAWAQGNTLSAVHRTLRSQIDLAPMLRATAGETLPPGYLSSPNPTPHPFDEVLAPQVGPVIWLAPVYAHASTAANTYSNVAGFLAGVDLINNSATQIGLAMGYSYTGLTSGADRGSSNALHLGTYGHWNHNDWFVNGTVQAALFEQSIQRRDIAGATGGSFAPVGQSNFSGMGLGATLEFGHQFMLDNDLTISPYLGLSTQMVSTQGARETGAGIFSLDIASSSLAQIDIGPGLRLQSPAIALDDGNTLQLTGDIGYARVAGADQTSSTTLLGRDITSSADHGREVLKLGGKLNLSTANGNTWFASYDGEFRRAASSHAFSAGIKAQF